MYAAFENHKDIVRMLLDSGCDIHIQNKVTFADPSTYSDNPDSDNTSAVALSCQIVAVSLGEGSALMGSSLTSVCFSDGIARNDGDDVCRGRGGEGYDQGQRRGGRTCGMALLAVYSGSLQDTNEIIDECFSLLPIYLVPLRTKR